MQRRRPVADQGRPPHACQWPAWQPPVTTLTGCGAPWRTRTAGSPSWTASTSRAALTGRRAGNLDQLPFNTAQDEFPGGYLAAAASTTGVLGDVRRCQVRHRTTRTSGCWAGTRRPRKASSPAASPTSRPACASPGASSGRAPTSSSRSPAAPASAPLARSAAPTPPASTSRSNGPTPTAASASPNSAGTSSPRSPSASPAR